MLIVADSELFAAKHRKLRSPRRACGEAQWKLAQKPMKRLDINHYADIRCVPSSSWRR